LTLLLAPPDSGVQDPREEECKCIGRAVAAARPAGYVPKSLASDNLEGNADTLNLITKVIAVTIPQSLEKGIWLPRSKRV
jgi:hypothetical protein